MHWVAKIQLIMMIEEDLDRIRRDEKPWIDYIWRGKEEPLDPVNSSSSNSAQRNIQSAGGARAPSSVW